MSSVYLADFFSFFQSARICIKISPSIKLSTTYIYNTTYLCTYISSQFLSNFSLLVFMTSHSWSSALILITDDNVEGYPYLLSLLYKKIKVVCLVENISNKKHFWSFWFCHYNYIHIRGHPHITSPPWGEGGFAKWWHMMTGGGRGLRNDDIINKGSFLEPYPKKITQ